jgi:tetratricopeptide (TPR) repeat protein
MDKVRKESENLEMSSGLEKGISQAVPHSKDELLFTIKKKIKEANLYYEFEQYDKAARLYEELSTAQIVFTEKDKVVNNLAECYFYLGHFELAMETYQKILKDFFNTPYRLNAQLGEGKCLIHLGEFGEARRVLYLLIAKEAKYDEEEEKSKVIEAYYKIAESYIAQAKEHKGKGQVISNHGNL